MTAAPDRSAPRGGGARREWPWALVGLFFVAAPALFWGGHAVFDETLSFILRRYWTERSVLQRVFDPRGWDFYEARELSYAIDLLDSQWQRLLLSRDVVFFVPVSSILASLALIVVGLRLAPRALPHLDRATRWLLLLVFLSNFVFVSTMGWLYRATKPLVAVLLLGLLLLVVAEHRRPRLGPRAGFAAVLGAALAMCLLDRQGLFYVLVLALCLALAWNRTRRGLGLALGAVTAIALWTAYNYVLGPWIIHALNGYWPEFRFQRLRPGRLLQWPPWLSAVELLGDWTSVLLGGLPPLVLAAAAALAGAAWAWRARRRRGWLAASLAGVAVALAGQVAMVAIMVERHEPVTWVDHRLWYYPLPYQALVVFLLSWALDRRAARGEGSLPRWLPMALGAIVLVNVAQWPEKRLVMQTVPDFAEELRGSLLLAHALQSGRADPSLAGDHRRFYFECLDRFPRIAAHAAPQVSEGEGVLRPEVRGGRLVAWARHEAHLAARTRTAGRYVLAGGVRLRSAEDMRILMGSPPRLVAGIRRPQAAEGDEIFRVTVDLPAGVTDICLLSSLPEVEVPDQGGRASFALLLPVLLWPEPR